MRFRWVALLVVIFIVVDFATPMLPGAVQLTDGSLEIDSGLYGRRANGLAPAVAPQPPHVSTVEPARHLTFHAGRVDCTSPPAPLLFRALLRPHSTPASSLDDD
jgi:hypothetical protein